MIATKMLFGVLFDPAVSRVSLTLTAGGRVELSTYQVSILEEGSCVKTISIDLLQIWLLVSTCEILQQGQRSKRSCQSSLGNYQSSCKLSSRTDVASTLLRSL